MKKLPTYTRVLLLPLSALLLSPNGRAQDYSIDWFNIGGGGGTSAEQTYSLSGTVGQPDAGEMTGGTYTLQGGFWPGLIVPSDTGAPTLLIQQTAGNVTISWSPAAPGFVLEETADLTTPSWSPASAAGNPTAPIPPASSAKFYRLRKP